MTMSRITRRAAVFAALVVATACTALRRGDVAPTLDTINPDSVFFPAGGVVEVTLTGTGFLHGTPGGNTVHLGLATLRRQRQEGGVVL